MSRVILFRGKRKSDGEWIFGNLLQTNNDGICIIQNHVPHRLLKNYEVDSETVCQYTGLTDKNGRKIFEGDIVRSDGANNGTFIVKWSEEFAGWCLVSAENDRMLSGFFGETYTPKDCEITGNIFDNPELLEEGTE